MNPSLACELGFSFSATPQPAHASPLYFVRFARSDRIRARTAAGMWFLEIHSVQQFLCFRQGYGPIRQQPNQISPRCRTGSSSGRKPKSDESHPKK
jgi:hypothetical protein